MIFCVIMVLGLVNKSQLINEAYNNFWYKISSTYTHTYTYTICSK